jgi:TRAP-type mannitol/chloroaromatic compound transport system permease small subunit
MPDDQPRGRTRTRRLIALASGLELLILWIGRAVSWLSLLMVIVTFLVVVLRYAFDLGWIAMQESVTYMHASLFMLAAAYTLQRGGHVRVDIFYQRLSARGRAWVDLLGTLFLLAPMCAYLAWSGWDYVAESWAVHEGSREAGGIPAVYLLKSLILAMPALLLLQGFAWALRNGLVLAGVETAAPTAGEADG